MPRYQKPTKDATSCEKPRGGAHIHRAGGVRMRELIQEKEPVYPYMSKVVYEKGTWGTETS